MIWDRKETQDIFYVGQNKTHKAPIVMQNSFKMHKAVKLLASWHKGESFSGIAEVFVWIAGISPEMIAIFYGSRNLDFSTNEFN